MLFVGMLVVGCGPSALSVPVEGLELQATGLDVRVTSGGKGSYVSGIPDPSRKRKTFEIGPLGFQRLLKSVEPFRSKAGPTGKTVERFLATACPKDVPFVTDHGSISVRWMGKSLDRVFIADLGCDYVRNRSRNEQLLAILKTLPVPNPEPWP